MQKFIHELYIYKLLLVQIDIALYKTSALRLSVLLRKKNVLLQLYLHKDTFKTIKGVMIVYLKLQML